MHKRTRHHSKPTSKKMEIATNINKLRKLIGDKKYLQQKRRIVAKKLVRIETKIEELKKTLR